MRKVWPKIFFVAILLFWSGFLFAQENLRLEGVVEDKNPSQSLAIINGQPYQNGDKVGEFQITQIAANQTTLRDPGGKEITLLVKAAEPVPVAPATAEVEPSKSLWDQAKDLWKHPKKMGHLAWELKAIRDLAVINNAAVHYYEKNKFFPVRLRQLTLDGFLGKEYESGKMNRYQFYLSNKPMQPDDFQLHADPQEPSSGLRYFFVGSDAQIRVSDDKPADLQSPAIKPMRK